MPDKAWIEGIKPHLGGHYELDRLWKEHQALEEQLAELDKIKWLTPEQETHRKALQKQKLAGKDRMIELVREIS